MANYVRNPEKQMAKWARDFVTWSQSDFGFYVTRYFDLKKKLWVKSIGPVRWTEDQIKAFHILLDFDAHGRPPFSEVWWLDCGQTGKSLANAAVCQWMGMFHDTDADIQIISNSEKQSQKRVYNALRVSMQKHPYGKALADVLEKGGIYFRDTGNNATPIPKNAATQAGGSPVLRSIDEMWDWTDESDDQVMGEIKETPARNVSMLWVSTYPGYLNDEGPLNKQINGMFDENDMPLDGTLSLHDDLPLYVKDGAAMWWNHEAVKRYPWITQGFMNRQMANVKEAEADKQRHWFARRAPRKASFLPIASWDACGDPYWDPLGPDDRDVVMVIGVDIGIDQDSTACVARGYNVETGKYELLDHRIWSPADFPGDTRKVVAAAKEWILDKHRKHQVLGIFYDPSQFQGAASDLEDDGVPTFPLTQNLNRTAADTWYHSLIINGDLRNYVQSEDLRVHVQHAASIAAKGQGLRIKKEKLALKVDGAVADSMACFGVLQKKDEFVRLRRIRRKAYKPRPVEKSVFTETFFGVMRHD